MIRLMLLSLLATPALAQEVRTGTLPSGSLYELTVPPAWNGDLVMYFPGIQFPGEDPEINAEGFPLEAFGAVGYAVATHACSAKATGSSYGLDFIGGRGPRDR